MLPILLKKMKKRLSGKKICGAGAKFYIGQSFSYFSRLSWLQYQGRKLHTTTNIFLSSINISSNTLKIMFFTRANTYLKKPGIQGWYSDLFAWYESDWSIVFSIFRQSYSRSLIYGPVSNVPRDDHQNNVNGNRSFHSIYGKLCHVGNICIWRPTVLPFSCGSYP